VNVPRREGVANHTDPCHASGIEEVEMPLFFLWLAAIQNLESTENLTGFPGGLGACNLLRPKAYCR